jgi:hypothetical protein
MGNVTGMRFEPTYTRLNPGGQKVYFAGLSRLRVTRWSRRRGFKTASKALEYARRWGERAGRVIKGLEEKIDLTVKNELTGQVLAHTTAGNIVSEDESHD